MVDGLGGRVAGAGPMLARLSLLLLHRMGEAGKIDRDAALAQRVLRQIEREAVRVVELERRLAIQHIAGVQCIRRLREQAEAAHQRLAEARLLELQRLGDQLFAAQQFGIGLAHLAHQRRHQLPHQRLFGAEQLRMAHGAAHDAAQHVAATFVRRQHAIGDQEGGRAQMVGNDAEGGDRLLVRPLPERGRRRVDQVTEQIGLENALDPLQDGGHAFQAHAGVDRRPRQVDALFLGDLLILHEHQVPEFKEAVAVLLRAAGRAAPDVLATVDEDFRAWPARSGVAHRPEIVGGRDAEDAVIGETGDLLPEAGRLVIGVIDGDQQLVLVQPELLGNQVPGQLDGALLEIVAEGEIAEHFEKSQVARGVADIVEVVVLAAGAHALLSGRGARIGPLLQAGEDVLELHHAGIGEHQRRVVARHERARRDDLVALLAEIVEECRPDLVHATHDCCLFAKTAGAAGGHWSLLFRRSTWPFSGHAPPCPETRNWANPATAKPASRCPKTKTAGAKASGLKRNTKELGYLSIG
ncbi:hypothetical protein X747_26690 [Mesorhizobium sp. LNJC384A00]|nr:hypothetical protein X747_26690 [Mesorhizobium sp. LNJC384A00]